MFGIEIVDAAFLPAALVALAGGLLSFLSPCVLPIVPAYLAYMGGIQLDRDAALPAGPGLAPVRDAGRPVLAALFFVLGISTVFMALGFTASAFGRLFLDYQDWLGRITGAMVILFGLHFLGVLRIPFLDRDMRLDAGDRGGSAFGAYVLGLAFAFGWTPCIGPQLGAILSVAMNQADVTRGTALLAIYVAGLGLPFVLAAFYLERAGQVLSRLRPHMRRIKMAMGALLILVGIALITKAFSRFSLWLLETFPAAANLG